jgi:hypothetical protein
MLQHCSMPPEKRSVKTAVKKNVILPDNWD